MRQLKCIPNPRTCIPILRPRHRPSCSYPCSPPPLLLRAVLRPTRRHLCARQRNMQQNNPSYKEIRIKPAPPPTSTPFHLPAPLTLPAPLETVFNASNIQPDDYSRSAKPVPYRLKRRRKPRLRLKTGAIASLPPASSLIASACTKTRL
jgi:hypothetical protein